MFFFLIPFVSCVNLIVVASVSLVDVTSESVTVKKSSKYVNISESTIFDFTTTPNGYEKPITLWYTNYGDEKPSTEKVAEEIKPAIDHQNLGNISRETASRKIEDHNEDLQQIFLSDFISAPILAPTSYLIEEPYTTHITPTYSDQFTLPNQQSDTNRSKTTEEIIKKSNLHVTKYSDFSTLPLVTDSSATIYDYTTSMEQINTSYFQENAASHRDQTPITRNVFNEKNKIDTNEDYSVQEVHATDSTYDSTDLYLKSNNIVTANDYKTIVDQYDTTPTNMDPKQSTTTENILIKPIDDQRSFLSLPSNPFYLYNPFQFKIPVAVVYDEPLVWSEVKEETKGLNENIAKATLSAEINSVPLKSAVNSSAIYFTGSTEINDIHLSEITTLKLTEKAYSNHDLTTTILPEYYDYLDDNFNGIQNKTQYTDNSISRETSTIHMLTPTIERSDEETTPRILVLISPHQQPETIMNYLNKLSDSVDGISVKEPLSVQINSSQINLAVNSSEKAMNEINNNTQLSKIAELNITEKPYSSHVVATTIPPELGIPTILENINNDNLEKNITVIPTITTNTDIPINGSKIEILTTTVEKSDEVTTSQQQSQENTLNLNSFSDTYNQLAVVIPNIRQNLSLPSLIMGEYVKKIKKQKGNMATPEASSNFHTTPSSLSHLNNQAFNNNSSMSRKYMAIQKGSRGSIKYRNTLTTTNMHGDTHKSSTVNNHQNKSFARNEDSLNSSYVPSTKVSKEPVKAEHFAKVAVQYSKRPTIRNRGNFKYFIDKKSVPTSAETSKSTIFESFATNRQVNDSISDSVLLNQPKITVNYDVRSNVSDSKDYDSHHQSKYTESMNYQTNETMTENTDGSKIIAPNIYEKQLRQSTLQKITQNPIKGRNMHTHHQAVEDEIKASVEQTLTQSPEYHSTSYRNISKDSMSYPNPGNNLMNVKENDGKAHTISVEPNVLNTTFNIRTESTTKTKVHNSLNAGFINNQHPGKLNSSIMNYNVNAGTQNNTYFPILSPSERRMDPNNTFIFLNRTTQEGMVKPALNESDSNFKSTFRLTSSFNIDRNK